MTKTTDIATVLEVSAILERKIDGGCDINTITGVAVREIPARLTRDGVSCWGVFVAIPGDVEYLLRSFRITGKQAARVYAEDVADALGLEVS